MKIKTSPILIWCLNVSKLCAHIFVGIYNCFDPCEWNPVIYIVCVNVDNLLLSPPPAQWVLRQNKALPEPVTQNVIFTVPEWTWLLMLLPSLCFQIPLYSHPVYMCVWCRLYMWNIYAFLRFSHKYNWFYDGHNTTKTNKIKYTYA